MSIERDGDEFGDGREGAVVDGGELPATAAKRRVLADHREVVESVVEVADAVADGWDGTFATDRTDVVDPMASKLASRGTDTALVDVLIGAVEAAGYALRADPVPSPPYLAVTGRGPILRGTVAEGRLVVEFRVFGIERTEAGPRYVRTGASPASVLTVEFRGDPA